MLDHGPPETADARKSKELTKTDLGMEGSGHLVSTAYFKLWLLCCVAFVVRALRRISTRLQASLPTLRLGKRAEEDAAKKAGGTWPGSRPAPTVDVTQFSESGYGSTDDLDSSRSSSTHRTSILLTPLTPPPPLTPVPSSGADEMTALDSIDDSVATVLGAVVQTRMVTAVFELSGAGLGLLQGDVGAELDAWFKEEGGLVVASELVWSVPAGQRKPAAEIALRAAFFAALRRNNKRVLDKTWPQRRFSERPISLPDSEIEEMSGRNKGLNAYQGSYRRSYDTLLPLRHAPTAPAHADYWDFRRDLASPAPHAFLFGNRRRVEELTTTTLVALNILAISFTSTPRP